jgi:hypothetical protein
LKISLNDKNEKLEPTLASMTNLVTLAILTEQFCTITEGLTLVLRQYRLEPLLRALMASLLYKLINHHGFNVLFFDR